MIFLRYQLVACNPCSLQFLTMASISAPQSGFGHFVPGNKSEIIPSNNGTSWKNMGSNVDKKRFSYFNLTFWLILRHIKWGSTCHFIDQSPFCNLNYFLCNTLEMIQIIQEWIKWNLWKTIFKKFEVVWSA